MKSRLVNEFVLFSVLLAVGFLLLPLAVYGVGNVIFGAYSGGYGRFFGALSHRLVHADFSAWFLVLSPYLVVQTVRLALLAFRRTPATNA